MTLMSDSGAPGAERPEAEQGSPLLALSDVRVHFGGVKAVDGVDLTFDGDRIYGLMGPNGSGKSTLLAAISRLVALTSGSLYFSGRRYDATPPHVLPWWGFARTFQTVRLVPDLNVSDNILLGAGVGVRATMWSDRRNRRELASRAQRAIELTGLEPFVRRRPDELSYGVQRRVEIARALAMSPRLLLLDEPVAGMTKPERASIVRLLLQLRSEGITQILVEHDVQMMVDACDYVYAMNTGKLVAEGTPHEVVRDPVVQEAYLGRDRGHLA